MVSLERRYVGERDRAVAETIQVQQQYSASLQSANQIGQALLATQFPEMLSGDPVAALQQMAATNPQRAQACLQVLNAGAQIEAQQQQWQQAQAQHHEQVRQQEFSAYKSQQDAQLAEMTKDIPREQMYGLAQTLAEEAGAELGVLVEEARTNPVLNHAGFQMLMIDGLRYRQAKKAGKSVPTYDLPRVQRPGVARSPGERSSNALSDRTARAAAD